MSSDITSSPIVMALKLRSVDGVPHVGAAFADATNRVLGVSEFADNDLFSNVEVSQIDRSWTSCCRFADYPSLVSSLSLW